MPYFLALLILEGLKYWDKYIIRIAFSLYSSPIVPIPEHQIALLSSKNAIPDSNRVFLGKLGNEAIILVLLSWVLGHTDMICMSRKLDIVLIGPDNLAPIVLHLMLTGGSKE